jgi:GT2 family glycosyltransferase
MPDAPITIAVVTACFNRRQTTLRCLRTLFEQSPEAARLEVHLLDDASPDGTAAAVACRYPQVHLLHGNGNLFWGGGMREAMSAADRATYDFMLWLNDDVQLAADAISQLLEAHRAVARAQPNQAHIIVGSLSDPAGGGFSYAGFRRKNRWHPAQLERARPAGGDLINCDTMNGNCVLVPRSVVDKIGFIDPAFTHQLGDIDYGYRARRVGCRIWATPSPVGTCEPNRKPRRWRDRSLSFGERLRILNTPHGLPVRPWFTFMWRYAGPLGAALLLLSYVKAFGGPLFHRHGTPA